MALLIGCGGGAWLSPTEPSQGIGLGRVATIRKIDATWMLHKARNENLLYVGGNNGYVTVYSYPKGTLVGALKNPNFFLPAGECVDKAGDVFITDLGANKIFAYRHASKVPFETLQAAAGDPAGCAIDPTTGNLAVTTLGRGSNGNVAVYPHARGTPVTYADPRIQSYFWCGFDTRGNLYLDGQASHYFAFAELPKNDKKLIDITLDHKMDFPGGVQWDGTYVAVGDQATSVIYHFKIKHSTGVLVGQTDLQGSDAMQQFWIQGDRIIGGNHDTHGPVHYWNYPAGGTFTKTIRKGVGGPIGMTVSMARR